MTTFILHGGATSKSSPYNDAFYREITKNLPNEAVVLCIYFARENTDSWSLCFNQDTNKLIASARDKTITTILASDTPETFRVELASADAVYIRGGDTPLLRQRLNKTPDWFSHISCNSIAGSSAGAYLLATHYYTRSKDEIRDGFGILPVKVLCHYTNDMADKAAALAAYGNNLPVYKIPETEFVILKKD